jgi:hypothetical protein
MTSNNLTQEHSGKQRYSMLNLFSVAMPGGGVYASFWCRETLIYSSFMIHLKYFWQDKSNAEIKQPH